MEENKTLTAKEVFEQIVKLQTQLAENSNHSLHRMGDAFESAFNYEQDEFSGDKKAEAIGQITSVFVQREQTLQKMLALYERIYDDIMKAEMFAVKADAIQKSFRDLMTCRACTELDSDEKLTALIDIGERIQCLLSNLINGEVTPQ